ncbi:HTTM domain-containing protein [Neolewinella antarctica]|uniref:HTTM-like domain-containing protein n=1 Tax=Neolewinella antarctica TaxID=442734 RepID=A0ABX0X860_9BACT|nr:HTTM domain-containing protein [Neolewinella antarctica]NJC25418.1 hypothetical protein [Neolewinella antarctica]
MKWSQSQPTPIHTLVWLRIAMGLLGAGDILGNGIYYHWHLDAFRGFTFRYYGFEWVQPLPEPLLSLFFVVGFLLGIAVALGWRFRWTAPLFALFFSYLFFLEKAHYLNHAYLFMVLTWLLCLTPAWREFSLDVRRNPADWSPVAPAWSVYLFPALMGVVYFFGGVNKINHDWLIEAMPMHMWLSNRSEMPVLGPLFAQKITAYVMSWGGMLLDLTAGFMLIHKRLRWLALALLFFFHATNHLIFNIGIFPYLSMVLTSLFFAPDWPKRAVDWVADNSRWAWARTQVRGWRSEWRRILASRPAANQSTGARKFWQTEPTYRLPLAVVLVLLFVVQLALPLRNHFFSNDVNWTEEGHRYSWRMMLRSKQGYGKYRVTDLRSGEEFRINPADSLNHKQYRKMATHPDMILQYAHHLRDQYAERGRNVAIYPDFVVRLNGRDRQQFLDPTVDLARIEWTWGEKNWILPEEKE